MGGEPLDRNSLFLTDLVISYVKDNFPNKQIYLWTGYTYEELLKRSDSRLKSILQKVNVLIDGPYINELRDITLSMRGSSNQKILTLN